MRRDVGFAALDDSGRPRPGLTPESVKEMALDCLRAYEPRVRFTGAIAVFDGNRLSAIDVRYEGKAGTSHAVHVEYPASR